MNCGLTNCMREFIHILNGLISKPAQSVFAWNLRNKCQLHTEGMFGSAKFKE